MAQGEISELREYFTRYKQDHKKLKEKMKEELAATKAETDCLRN